MGVINPKAILRQELKHKRLFINDRPNRSHAICLKLLELPEWSKVVRIHIYEAIQSLGEVDISLFVASLQQVNPDCLIFTSRKVNKTWQITGLNKEEYPPNYTFDVVIVPMLGFDSGLQRLGYGGGYYDRFLSTQPKARKIGVCFEACKVSTIPYEDHDIKMNIIVTESQVYY